MAKDEKAVMVSITCKSSYKIKTLGFMGVLRRRRTAMHMKGLRGNGRIVEGKISDEVFRSLSDIIGLLIGFGELVGILGHIAVGNITGVRIFKKTTENVKTINEISSLVYLTVRLVDLICNNYICPKTSANREPCNYWFWYSSNWSILRYKNSLFSKYE